MEAGAGAGGTDSSETGGSDTGGSDTGGSDTGGSDTGGSDSGGSGGESTASGGATTGGGGTGGEPATGGTGTGGDPATGGTGTGGVGTGGDPATGGTGTGGDPATGGVGSGGDPATGGTGTGGTTYVSANIPKSITKQLSPLDLNEPFIIEVGTNSYFPVTLTNPQATVPDGWVLGKIEEVPGNCPYVSNGKERCLQLFQVHMYPMEGVCQLTQDEIHWSWDVACGEGGDCNLMPPSLVSPITLTTKHSSEFFCEQEIDVGLFLPQVSLLMPTQGTDPVTVRLFTRLEYPYTFSPGSFSAPAGMSVQSFTENDIDCDADGCRQWWDAVIDPGVACNMKGDYTAVFNVGCVGGGICDPGVTTYTSNFKISENRSLCSQ
jgi:hypothetical protein